MLESMKTRMEKWARYRSKIAATPADKFKNKPHFTNASDEETALLLEKGRASSAVTAKGLPTKKVTPWGVYLSKKRRALIFKFVLLVVAVAGMIALWFLWVRK